MSATEKEFNLLNLIDILRSIKDETNHIQLIERIIRKHCDFTWIMSSGRTNFESRQGYYLQHRNKTNHVFEENRYIIANGLVSTHIPDAVRSRHCDEIDKIHQTLIDPYSDTNISVTAVPSATVIGSKNTAKALKIQELNWLIFHFLDLRSLLNFRSVNQRLLYDGYNTNCIFNIDLYQISKYVCYLRRGTMSSYRCDFYTNSDAADDDDQVDGIWRNNRSDYRMIRHVLPIDNCQSVTINVNDITRKEWPQIAKQNKDWKIDGEKINIKYLQIKMYLKRIIVQDGKFEWFSRSLTERTCMDAGKQWLIKWINDCCNINELKRIVVILHNDSIEMKCTNSGENGKKFKKNLIDYGNFIDAVSDQLLKKKEECNVAMKFRIINPLSVCIEGSRAKKWRNTSLNLSKSTLMVSVIQLLRKWYENGNINVTLNFIVTHGIEDLNSFNIKKEQWMQLIFKIIKQEFVIDKNDNCHVWHFLQCGQLSNTMVLNDRMKITYEVSNSRQSVRNDYKSLSVLLSISLDWKSNSF